MRQQGDISYRDLLSRIRIGLLTKSDSEILENRKISFNDISFQSRLNKLCDVIHDLPPDTVCLLPTCHMCDVLNDAMLSRIPSKEILLIAEDIIECIQYVKKKVLKMLSDNDNDNSRTAGLSKQIIIKVGAKVMIRRNIDASLGLVNGTIATVTSVVEDMSSNQIEKIKLLLPSGMEYLIERVSVKFEVMDRAYVIRKQFPLSLSYGITIHKSQALSLQNAIMDIGNSVFNCGQVYVALSRVTTIEGLHLINYDPSSVKASEEAIIEYNRLKRKIYKAETTMITISKKKHRKIKDVLWTLPKMVSHIQESYQESSQNIACVINGFENTDKVSCYANAIMQCVLHLNDIRQLLILDKLNVIGKLAYRYEKGITPLNTYAIRQYLGEYFSDNRKRDAFEFLMALCDKYDYIKNSFLYKMNSISCCKTCGSKKCTTSENTVISMSINHLKEKSYNLQDLINVTFSHWNQLFNEPCEHCAENNMLFKNELISTQKIFAIRIILQDDKLMKKHKINLCAVPKTKVLIAGHFYKVNNAIFHHGSNIDSGHYTSMCREGTSNVWIEADDMQIKNKSWPRGSKDIYILFCRKLIINK